MSIEPSLRHFQKIKPYIDVESGKPRLIEVPHNDLKQIQKRIKVILSKLCIPNYVFSGIKGRSYVDNAAFHKGSKYLFKIDIKAFFPNTPREKIYNFFYYKFKMAPDIAEILTNFTTVDLDRVKTIQKEQVNNFILTKGIKCKNHLISGSPVSPILSYYAAEDMFNKLYRISCENGLVMTVYIDDVVFSSENYISAKIRKKIVDVIIGHGYRISSGKVKLYNKFLPKKVTGVVIDSNGNFALPNALQYKIITDFRKLKNGIREQGNKERLKGYIAAARQIKKDVFPAIYQYIK